MKPTDYQLLFINASSFTISLTNIDIVLKIILLITELRTFCDTNKNREVGGKGVRVVGRISYSELDHKTFTGSRVLHVMSRWQHWCS